MQSVYVKKDEVDEATVKVEGVSESLFEKEKRGNICEWRSSGVELILCLVWVWK